MVEIDAPVELINADGTSPICLLCEHASAFIPSSYNDLGLNPQQRFSHAAWDPGARALSLRLSHVLDAPLVASRVSRLMYDCNRPLDAPSAIPERSELIDVPGNVGLDAAQRQQRADLFYSPFTQAVSALLDRRIAAGVATAVVTVHSFSPTYFGRTREVEFGFLHDLDRRFADAMLAQPQHNRKIMRNQPYGPNDGVTHSLQVHAQSRGLPNVMLEIRNDLLAKPAQIEAVCAELTEILRVALVELDWGQVDA